MGFFKDVHTITKQAKEIDKTWDPAAQARAGTERMAEATAMMAATTAALAAPPEDAVDASASVVSAGMANGMINGNPVVPVELLIQQDGMPPRPLSTSVMVPVTELARVHAGATLPVKLSRSNPAALAVDWSAPA